MTSVFSKVAVTTAVAAAAAAAVYIISKKRERDEASQAVPTVLAKVVSLEAFLADPNSAEAQEECAAVAKSLLETGIVLLKDPRVSGDAQTEFLDMMEDYFDQPTELKMPDVRKELHHQVGATPSMVEVPICKADAECQQTIRKMPKKDRPLPIVGPDPKWRFFWRIGERPTSGGFEDLNAEPVLPTAFPQWATKMETWGNLMLGAVTTCAEMAAVGFGLPRDALSSMMEKGPHLLAPTGSDLTGANRKAGTVLAGWHNDLNLLTIHGKSRYPGLFVWLKDGSKMGVKVPPGCLLVQAAQQLEHLTGGAVHAGMHEVVVLPSTIAAAEAAEASGRPAWRVSSTLFAHIASSQTLRPLGPFATPEREAAYVPISAGEQVMNVLKKIALAG